MEAHRRQLAHREMVNAYTTAAIINYAFSPPKEPVQPTAFMPNYRQESTPVQAVSKFTEDELLDWQTRIANLAAELRQGGGKMLDEIRSNNDG